MTSSIDVGVAQEIGPIVASTRRNRVALNIALNIFATFFTASVGFVTMPFLVSHLGSEMYGQWVLVMAATGVFAVLDFGVAASVGRLVAGMRATDDIEGINKVLSTGLALLMVMAALALSGSLVVMSVFPMVFHVDPGRVEDVRRAIILVGIGVSLSLPASVFGTLLCSYERFDLDNLIEMVMLSIRLGLTLALLSTHASLTTVAAITLGASSIGALATVAACWKVEPRVQFAIRSIDRSSFDQIRTFGLWYFALVMGRTLTPQIAPTVIGLVLGSAAVTPYAIARQLVFYANTVVSTAARTMAPRTALSAFTNDTGALKRIFLTGGRLCFALSAFIVGGLLVLGRPFLHFWQHARGDDAYIPLVILALGELIPMSQWIAAVLLTSMGRHRHVALLVAIEAVVTLALTSLVAGTAGLSGVCAGVAVSALIFRGGLVARYGRVVLAVSWSKLCGTMLPVMTAGVAAPLLAACVALVWPPSTIVGFARLSATYGIFAGIGMLVVLPELYFTDLNTRIVFKAWRRQRISRVL